VRRITLEIEVSNIQCVGGMLGKKTELVTSNWRNWLAIEIHILQNSNFLTEPHGVSTL
jgi:hypothetical protein